MSRTLIALLFGGLLFAALPAFAQDDSVGSGALTISASPTYPVPNSVVRLTAESPLLDLQDSAIAWRVNGVPAGSGQSINVTLGALGKETAVTASVSGESGSDSAEIDIVPTSIDLLWESSSYVPPFYKGRAAAGSGSMIRVLAIPHFVGVNGAGVPSSNIDFTWKVNGAVDESQSGVGESSAVFPAAVLYDTDEIDVVARSTDGALSGEATVAVRTGDPELVLYEDNPLFGVMYHDAMPQSSTASESETTFAAVPYYADAVSANSPSLAYQWQVNGSNVAADPKDPSEVTLSTQSASVANVQLSVQAPSDPFFSASGSWQISFNGPSANDTDLFHSSTSQ